MYEHYHAVMMRSVRDKWKESTFLDWVARNLNMDRSTISLQTTVPTEDAIESVISYLVWHHCSLDKGLLPKDRLPTLEEIRSIFSHTSGGD